MKNLLAASLLAASAFVLAACGAEVKTEMITPPAKAPEGGPAAPAAKAPAGEYPLTTCVVSGEKLGGMGDPVIYDHQGTEVRFCCPHCVEDFKKDPRKYIAILEAAKARK